MTKWPNQAYLATIFFYYFWIFSPLSIIYSSTESVRYNSLFLVSILFFPFGCCCCYFCCRLINSCGNGDINFRLRWLLAYALIKAHHLIYKQILKTYWVLDFICKNFYMTMRHLAGSFSFWVVNGAEDLEIVHYLSQS